MTVKRLVPNAMAVLLVAVLLVGAAACKPKPPAMPADSIDTTTREAPPPEPTPVTPPPRVNTDRDARPSPWDQDLQTAQQEAERTGLLGTVYFELDSSDLDSSARDRLAKNAKFMADHPEFLFTIEGHCDERGTNAYNLALGERRASSTRGYVTSLGVDSSRLKTISYGEERGVCSQSQESCWSQNRRAYFKITGRR